MPAFEYEGLQIEVDDEGYLLRFNDWKEKVACGLAEARGAVDAAADGRPLEAGFARRAEHAVPADSLYKSPIQLLLSKDGRRLFVACENDAGNHGQTPGAANSRVAVHPSPRQLSGQVAETAASQYGVVEDVVKRGRQPPPPAIHDR